MIDTDRVIGEVAEVLWPLEDKRPIEGSSLLSGLPLAE
jgi:hypothetical protein